MNYDIDNIAQEEREHESRMAQIDAEDEYIDSRAIHELPALIDGLAVGETMAILTDIELGALAEFIAEEDDCSAGFLIREAVRKNLWASARREAQRNLLKHNGKFYDIREIGDA